MEFRNPSEVMDGVDLNYDLHCLFGYFTTIIDEDFESAELLKYIEFILIKYGNLKPKVYFKKQYKEIKWKK